MSTGPHAFDSIRKGSEENTPFFSAALREPSAAMGLSGFRPDATPSGPWAKPIYLYASGWLVNKVTNLGQHSVTHLHIEQFGRLGDLEILFEILEHRGTKFRALAQ
jgi:hypothetical protein